MLTRLGVYKLWRENPERTWPFARRSVTWLTHFLAPSYGYGLDRVPLEGGAVLAANHFTEIDPALIGIYSRRTIYYMAKIELLSIPVAGELLRWTGAFAVRRGEADRDSLRVARWVVREGHVLGMFMEGTRQQLGYPGPAHPGAVMVAMQEGVPIVPCGIDTFRWSPRNRRPCCIVWGDPIRLDGLPRTGKGYKQGAAILEGELARLWRLAAQAVADGFPEVLADGARRSKPWRASDTIVYSELPAWPAEPWAEGPLGPVYRLSRARRRRSSRAD